MGCKWYEVWGALVQRDDTDDVSAGRNPCPSESAFEFERCGLAFSTKSSIGTQYKTAMGGRSLCLCGVTYAFEPQLSLSAEQPNALSDAVVP